MVTFNDIFQTNFLESFSTFSLTDTLLSLVAAMLIGLFIYYVYQKTYSGVLYNRSFNVSLVAILMVTTLVINGVTSNVVLSLGMVGALSIVRFRTAVKDPMDLVFLFWALAEGILCGASLLPLALIGCPVLGVFLLVFANRQQKDNPYLVILRLADSELETAVVEMLKKEVKKMQLKSKTVTGGAGTELIYEIRPNDSNTAFINEISKVEGVESAVMVSYDGNYAA
ncbi:MAG: DUF4956 domain-containing protein [Anaerotignum sp.]|nr:DUF4956 domain-containing protein [Anaerotignum sp.]